MPKGGQYFDLGNDEVGLITGSTHDLASMIRQKSKINLDHLDDFHLGVNFGILGAIDQRRASSIFMANAFADDNTEKLETDKGVCYELEQYEERILRSYDADELFDSSVSATKSVIQRFLNDSPWDSFKE